MTTGPVPVKQTNPLASAIPEIVQLFRTEMDRFVDRFTTGFGITPIPAFRSDPAFRLPNPAVDITEDDASFKFSAELPGLTEKDVQVSLSGNTLLIKGEKRRESDETDKGYHLSERCYGEFQRSFLLPEGADGDRIDARFANGVLTVIVPKTAQAAPKKIEVKASA
jgi:HSP20 family protein